MRKIIMSIGAVLAGASLAGAFDGPKKKPPAKETPTAIEQKKKETAESEKSVAQQIEAVQTALAEQRQKLVDEYQAAKSDEEKAKIVEQYNKDQADASEKYLAIVKKHPDDEALFPALQALVSTGKHTLMAIDLLLKHHLDNPQMGMLCFQLGSQGAPGSEKLLRAVAEKSKSNEAKGLALLALGQSLFSQSNQDGVDDDKRDELRKQAESALQSVVDDYADADVLDRKAGDMAGGILFEVQHLAIGKEVPDLEGEDLDGTAFKLSDYRGKVVFLDFWAHW